MFRVMIVDDEPLVRAGLRGSVDWAALGMAVTDEAANGREALERLCAADPPQVVLLDMEMPQMDGLRFLREVRDQQLPVQVIAVSNHEEYRYVRGALKLGAFDYLPKAGFDGTQLYAALQGLQGRLLESAGGELETYRERAKDFRRLLLCPGDAKIARRLEELFPAKGYRLCCFAPGGQAVGPAARLLFSAGWELGRIPSFAYNGGRVLAVVPVEGDERPRHSIETMARLVREQLQMPCPAAVSRVGYGYEELSALYEETVSCCEHWFYMHAPKLVYWEDVQGLSLTNRRHEEVDALLERMKEAVEYRELSRVRIIAREIFRSFRQQHSVLPKIVKNDFINIVNQCTNVLRRMDFPTEEIDRLFSYTDITEKRDIFELEDWVMEFLQKYGRLLERSPAEAPGGEAVMRSLRYLDQHYREHVTLAEVAAHANLSVNYFSTLFKKVTGMSMVEYVNHKRMEQAKKMLAQSADSRVNEVAYAIGFDSVSYFSKTFRQYVGVTAAEYKRRQIGK